MLINISRTWEFSGSPLSWPWCSHSGGPGPTSDLGIKNPQAVQHSQRKKKIKEKNTDEENPRMVTKQTETNKNNAKTENKQTKPNRTDEKKKKTETGNRQKTKQKAPNKQNNLKMRLVNIY